MILKIKIEKEFEVNFLQVNAGVRYWEDSIINGYSDEDGKLIPCREGDRWKPVININTGKIINWTEGAEAEIHYKICDDGDYQLIDIYGDIVSEIEGYVPGTMSPKENGYGDYIIMDINKDGLIKDWKFDSTEFIDNE